MKNLAVIMYYLILLSAAFSPPTNAAALNQHIKENFLVEANWITTHADDPLLVILDVRNATSYKKGHIPDAINIPVLKTFNPKHPKDRVGPIKYIQKLFSDAGVSNDSFVIIYDDSSYVDSGRVFWVLEVYGHKKVALLNGGYPAWQASGKKSSTVFPQIKRTTYIANIQPERLATKLHTRLAVTNNNQLLIDARSAEEYLGKISKFGRRGHIPGARNIPWELNYVNVKGVQKIKSLSELTSLYKGIDDTTKVITYCNKGKQSSFTYFILRQLGKNVSHYDGSWFEWSADASLPVEK